MLQVKLLPLLSTAQSFHTSELARVAAIIIHLAEPKVLLASRPSIIRWTALCRRTHARAAIHRSTTGIAVT